MIISFLTRHWKKILIVVGVLFLLEVGFRLFNINSPKTQTSTSSSSSSTSQLATAVSSTSVSVAGASVEASASQVQTDTKKTRSIVREKFRPDGTLESRETEREEVESSEKQNKTSLATKSIDLVLVQSSESVAVASSSAEASSSSLTVFHDETPQAGIGPIIWVTTDGTFAGLSYRIFELKSVQVNASAVVGTRVNSLPNLDLGAGGFVSKTMAPGLELGVVGVVKVPDLETQLGLGLSYQF